MNKFWILGAVCAFGLSVSQAALAQDLRDVSGPAETPPASFTGTQYVDSKGCVFLRSAGIGPVTWIPRVSRDRKLICGQTPTFAKATQPRVVRPAPAPVVVAQRPAPTPVVSTPVTAPVAAAVQPAAAPRIVPVRTVTPTRPSSQIVRRTLHSGQSACPNASRSSQPYIGRGSGVRCGPQTEGIASGQAVETQIAPAVVTPPAATTTQTVNRAATGWLPGWAQKAPDDRTGRVISGTPEGFRPVWEDDRLNPQRGLPRNSTQLASASTGSAGHRYVQVASYASMQDAQRVAQQLANRGLAAKIGQGRGQNVVLIGPFNSASALSSALQSARGQGYSNAFTRR